VLCVVTIVTGLCIVGLLRGPLQQVTNQGGQLTAEPLALCATNVCHMTGEPAAGAAFTPLMIPPHLLVGTNLGQVFGVIIGR
jgi:hypothetical protein